MVVSMKGSGLKICKTVWAKRLGWINQLIRASTSRDENTDKERISGPMEVYTVEVGQIIRSTERGLTNGPTGESM